MVARFVKKNIIIIIFLLALLGCAKPDKRYMVSGDQELIDKMRINIEMITSSGTRTKTLLNNGILANFEPTEDVELSIFYFSYENQLIGTFYQDNSIQREEHGINRFYILSRGSDIFVSFFSDEMYLPKKGENIMEARAKQAKLMDFQKFVSIKGLSRNAEKCLNQLFFLTPLNDIPPECTVEGEERRIDLQTNYLGN